MDPCTRRGPTTWVDEALGQATDLLEKVAGVEPGLVGSDEAERYLVLAAKAGNLVAAVQLALAPRLTRRDVGPRLARISGQGVGVAVSMLKTAARLDACPATREALARGELSYPQAAEIARTEADVAGSEAELLALARHTSLAHLKDRAKAIRQGALDREELEARRRKARFHRTWVDELGMVRYSGAMLPEVGVPFAARLDAETDRVFRTAYAKGEREERSAYAADAFAALVSGKGRGPARRPEIVLVGDLDRYGAGEGLSPHIPGVGPVSDETLRRHAKDAIVSVVLYEGKDFRTIRRWSRSMPVEIATVLEIGDPPHFEGRRCGRCGRRFRPQGDHRDPHAHGGLMSVENIDDLCGPCHHEKTEEDRRAGLLGPDPPARE